MTSEAILKMAEEGRLTPIEGRVRLPGEFLVMVEDENGNERYFIYDPEKHKE